MQPECSGDAAGMPAGSRGKGVPPEWAVAKARDHRPDAPRQCVLRVTGGVAARSNKFRCLGSYRGLEVIRNAGTPIGDNDGDVVTTPYDDCVLVMPSLRQARAGVTVVRFARQEPL